MKPDPETARTAIYNTRQAMQRGDRQAARDWAMRAVDLDPDSEEPWLYLAAVSSPKDSIHCLEQALKINPKSMRAHQGMQWALERLKPDGKTPAQTVARPAAFTPPQFKKTNTERRWSRSLNRFFSHWQNWIGILLVGIFITVALAAPWISPDNPKSPGPFMRVSGFSVGDREPRSPKVVPPLGTLAGQMDVFHALVWGTRGALSFSLVVVSLAGFFGLLFGAIAGYAGGGVSSIMMRITDSFLAFPIIAGVVLLNQLWFAVMVAAGGLYNPYQNTWAAEPAVISPIQVLLNSINPLALILILFSWMPYARITNAVVTTLKQAEFIQAARAIGAKSSRIIFRHLLPNSVSPSIVLAARDIGGIVIIQATFTFIGLDGSSIWGQMLVLGKDWVLGPGGGIFTYWWVFVPATLALVLFGIGWNLFGDGLSELLDPRDD